MLLWFIGQRFPREKWAFLLLREIYVRANNTRALNRLSSTMVSYDPTNFVVRNDLAGTDLLTKSGQHVDGTTSPDMPLSAFLDGLKTSLDSEGKIQVDPKPPTE